MTHDLMSTGAVAEELGIQWWRLHNLIRSGQAPAPTTVVGRYRYFERSQLPEIRAAAERKGLLKHRVNA